MSTDTTTGTPLRHRMIEDMAARNLNRHTQRSHISSCKRFAAWLRSLARHGNGRRGAPLSTASD